MSKTKYVKLVARPDTWFKVGTEVYDYDAPYEDKKRITLDYWNQCLNEGGICVRGIRICELGYETNGCLNCKPGEERIDGEYCTCDEFDAETIMPDNPIVIGVGGFARSGKDTFVKISKQVLKEHGFSSIKLAFADELKEEIDPFLKENYGISAWTDDTEEKRIIRPFLVAHGCGKRQQTNGAYWVDKIDKLIENVHFNEDVIFISDCRFPNEVKWVHDKWNGWFVHLSKYSVLSGMQYDSFTGKETGVRTWEQFDEAPNEEEAENDPICEKLADYNLKLENAIEREKRLHGNIITPESLINNSYLVEEITKCLSTYPAFSSVLKSLVPQ